MYYLCLLKKNRLNPHTLHCSLSMDKVEGIWGMAQSTNCSKLISACLNLLSTDIPRLLSLNLSAEQLKEVLGLPNGWTLRKQTQARQTQLIYSAAFFH